MPNIERRFNGAFDVYVPSNYGRAHIDTVFYSSATIDEVRRGLINHDGYQSNIEVEPQGEIVPLTTKELESICDDGGVCLVQEGNTWFWNGEDEDGDMRHGRDYETKEAAMLDAIACLNLETFEPIL